VSSGDPRPPDPAGFDDALAAYATVDLLPTASGGLGAAMPSGTRSLLVLFGDQPAPDGGLSVGAVIETIDGAALAPDANGLGVRLTFWTTEAMTIAATHDRFVLWYGRVVGNGRIDRDGGLK
jgi:hypothetical protein